LTLTFLYSLLDHMTIIWFIIIKVKIGNISGNPVGSRSCAAAVWGVFRWQSLHKGIGRRGTESGCRDVSGKESVHSHGTDWMI
jgi:hypothetical protein